MAKKPERWLIGRSGDIDHGIDLDTGEKLTAATTAERVTWMVDLVHGAALEMATRLWTAPVFDVLAAGTFDGSRLPSWGYKAAERIGWKPVLPVGVHASSRVGRAAAEQAVRSLRSAAERDRVIRVIVATWFATDATAEDRNRALAQRWEMLGTEVSRPWVRNMVRCVAKHLTANGVLPVGLIDIEPAPAIGKVADLSVADAQMLTRGQTGEPGQLSFDILLPTAALPDRQQWSWTKVTVRTDAAALAHLGMKPCPPRFRLDDGRLWVDLAFELPRRPLDADLERFRVLGVDWGTRRLATAAVVTLDETGASISDGRARFWQPGGLIELTRRERVHGEKLRAKLDQWERLTATHPDPHLAKLIARANIEIEALDQKRCAVNTEIANLTARWLVDQAIANGCGTIAFEDLTDLEPGRNFSKKNRTATSQSVRSLIMAATICAADYHGITVLHVPARGTSSTCSRCHHDLNHYQRPGGPSGYPWARCLHCGRSHDRDHAAAEHIAARGLAHLVLTATIEAAATAATATTTKTPRPTQVVAATNTVTTQPSPTPTPSPLHKRRQIPHQTIRDRAPSGHGSGRHRSGRHRPSPSGQTVNNSSQALIAPSDGLRYAYRNRHIRATPVPLTRHKT